MSINETVMVTGASGFVGFNLAHALAREGNDVIAIGQDSENDLEGFSGRVIQKRFHELDWEQVGPIATLYHQAAITDTSVHDETKMNFVNVDAAIKLFENAREHGCKHIVYASSTAVYGSSPAPFVEGQGENPLNAYGKSKLLLDERAREFAERHPDMSVVGLRYCNVFGPGESHKGKMATMVYQLAQQMLERDPRIFKWGEQKRDHIYVDDVVRANQCAARALGSCVVNCGTGATVTFNEMIGTLNETLGLTRKACYIDNPSPETYQTHTECDMTLAQNKIGFTPRIRFEEGVRKYYKSGKLAEPPRHSKSS